MKLVLKIDTSKLDEINTAILVLKNLRSMIEQPHDSHHVITVEEWRSVPTSPEPSLPVEEPKPLKKSKKAKGEWVIGSPTRIEEPKLSNGPPFAVLEPTSSKKSKPEVKPEISAIEEPKDPFVEFMDYLKEVIRNKSISHAKLLEILKVYNIESVPSLALQPELIPMVRNDMENAK